MPRRAGMHIRVILCFGCGKAARSLHIAASGVCTIIRQIAHFAGPRGTVAPVCERIGRTPTQHLAVCFESETGQCSIETKGSALNEMRIGNP
ncbi:hypothetical protein X773_27940 [Mesorhizobium sp. LSJC285A00]|nr:hypothetical protein X773_27940 [Mesorhizobium sp. LSJC285A00]